MSGDRPVRVDLPADLMAEVERLALAEDVDLSVLIQRAVRMYVRGERRREVREIFRRGYQEMADLNLSLAQESLLPDQDAWGKAPGATDGG